MGDDPALGRARHCIGVAADNLIGVRTPAELRWLMQINAMTSQIVLASGHGAGIVVLCQSEKWRRRLSGLGAAGRMALTNCLAQTF